RDLRLGARHSRARLVVVEADQELTDGYGIFRLDQHVANPANQRRRDLDFSRPWLDPAGRDRLPALLVVGRRTRIILGAPRGHEHRSRCAKAEREAEHEQRRLHRSEAQSHGQPCAHLRWTLARSSATLRFSLALRSSATRRSPPWRSSPTMHPSSMRTMRSAKGTIRGSWVTTNTERDGSLAMRASTSMMACPFSLSSAAVGSSARIADGLPTIARAIATRCCSPPLSSRGNALVLWPRPTMAKASLVLAMECAELSPRTSNASRTLSAAVKVGNRW